MTQNNTPNKNYPAKKKSAKQQKCTEH